MILQLQAKVHGLGNLRVLTTTYAILSLFKEPFFPPFLTIICKAQVASRLIAQRRSIFFACVHASSFCFTLGFFAGSDSLTSLSRFAWFA